MTLKIYNTLTRQKEDFKPLISPQVGMYVCGITPYDESHLGHARAYITFDLIRRYLEYSGYDVFHVQNITDVDDKIIKKSQELHVSSSEIAERFTASFFEVIDKLNVQRARFYPKATAHIPEMVNWIKGLVDKGFAYILDDGVYFEVEKFKDYGKLSRREKAGMEAGARVEIDKKKKSPWDFALWKKAKEGEPAWPSPWGPGRPGWHIECSAMSTKYLGEQFDIHGGGLDLEFPHHENEIAQTEALTNKIPWVKYWIHNGFVNINKQKMSKSLGNFFTLKDIYRKYDPMVIRFFILSTHYRSPINYSDGEIDSTKEAYNRICQFVADLDFILAKSRESAPPIEVEDILEDMLPYQEKFKAAMDDDFNSAGAIAAIFELIKFCRKTLDEGEAEAECLEIMKKTVVDLCAVLGLTLDLPKQSAEKVVSIDELVKEREAARAKKNFNRADEIRQSLAAQGIELEDTAYGTKWKSRT